MAQKSKMKSFKQFKKVSNRPPTDKNDTGQAGTGVTSDVTTMSLGDQYVNTMEVIEGYKMSMAEPHNTKALYTARGNGDAQMHKHLASAQHFANKNKKSYHVTIHHDSGEAITHKIHPIREDLDQADTLGDDGTESGTSGAPKSAKKLQKQSDARVKQKQKLASDEGSNMSNGN